jgi:hypothetical protein
MVEQHHDIVREQEFDCADCGRHIIALCHPAGQTRCAICKTIPGWFKDPVLREMIAPDAGEGEETKQ